MALQVGTKAPAISLHDSDKNKVNLADFAGKNVVIVFFPQSFTGVCTAELCSMRDSMATYNQTNAQVLGISVDSVFTLAKFKAENNLNFPLLSDFNKEASTAYECIYADWLFDMKGVSKRSAFVVDAHGVLQYVEVLENAGEQPNFTAIKECLAKLS